MGQFPSCWLSGLRHSGIGACRLLGRARSWCQNGHLREHSRWLIVSGASATRVLALHPQWATPSLRKPPKACRQVQPWLLWSYCFVLGPSLREISGATPQGRTLRFPPSCGAPALKSRWPQVQMFWGPSSWCQALRQRGLTWGSGLSLLWEKLCNIIIFQLWVTYLAGMRYDYVTKAPFLQLHCGLWV